MNGLDDLVVVVGPVVRLVDGSDVASVGVVVDSVFELSPSLCGLVSIVVVLVEASAVVTMES